MSLLFEGWDPTTLAWQLYTYTSGGTPETLLLNDATGVSANQELGVPGDGGGVQGKNYIGGPDLISYGGDVYVVEQGTDGYSDLFVYNPSNSSGISSSPNSSWEVNGPGNQGNVNGFSNPNDIVGYGSHVYFVAAPNGITGAEQLYVATTNNDTSSTSATLMTNAPLDPSSLVSFNGDLYLNGQISTSSDHGLYQYNGGSFTAIQGPDANFSPSDMVGAGKYLFMNGVDAQGRSALFVYEGNNSTPISLDAGSTSYSDAEGNKGRDPLDIVALPTTVGSDILYSGVDSTTGSRNIYVERVVNGTIEPATALKASGADALGKSGLDPYDLTVFNNEVFFTGNDSKGHRDLFVFNPAAGDTYTEVLDPSKYDLTDGYNNSQGSNNNLGFGNLNPTTVGVYSDSSGSHLYFGAANNPNTPGSVWSDPQLYQLNISGSGAHTTYSATAISQTSPPGLSPFGLTHS